MAVICYCVIILLLLPFLDCHLGSLPSEVSIEKWKKSIFMEKEVNQEHLTHKPPTHMVITTWFFGNATKAAYDSLANKNGTAIDAVVEGCSYCEEKQCDNTVGFGGSPDENGETTLDAMVFDGVTMDVGAVAGLRRIKNAVGVARAVLSHTDHSILVGDAATQFAKLMGFKEETLSTNKSTDQWRQWREAKCQPNFWKNVIPDPKTGCGPYKPKFNCENYISNTCHRGKPPKTLQSTTKLTSRLGLQSNKFRNEKTKKATRKGTLHMKLPETMDTNYYHHDTIGQIALDSMGAIAVGTSSNGAIHKIPGRMGDAAVPGAGGYADQRYGAAVATGDGDIMMRFGPALAVVERLKNKISPEKATRQVINQIRERYPNFKGAVLALSKSGAFGAACNGFGEFPFTVARSDWKDGFVKTYYIQCVDSL